MANYRTRPIQVDVANQAINMPDGGQLKWWHQTGRLVWFPHALFHFWSEGIVKFVVFVNYLFLEAEQKCAVFEMLEKHKIVIDFDYELWQLIG